MNSIWLPLAVVLLAAPLLAGPPVVQEAASALSAPAALPTGPAARTPPLAPAQGPGGSQAGHQIAAGGPDSLTTLYAATGVVSGFMVDITPSVNLRLGAVGVNHFAAPGTSLDVDVYYRLGSSGGNEQSSVGWSLLAGGSGSSAGSDAPTLVALPGAGFTFKAGLTYGLFVVLPGGGNTLGGSAGTPAVYANEDLCLKTNTGNVLPLFGAGTAVPDLRWNGTLYYETIPTLNVALAAAETDPAGLADVRAKLEATGKFNSVEVIEARTATPSLASLLRYDAVLTWTGSTYFDAAAMGDNLADYVDAGGGVVVAVFAASTTTVDRSLGGRFRSGGYEVIVTQSGNTAGAATLGAVAIPGHPVMKGVASFDGGASAFRPTGTALTAGSALIASWSDGRVLAAEGQPGRIDLGFFPPSSDQRSDFWDATTDGDRLLANALCAAATRKPRVLIAASPATGAWRTEVQAKLIASGKFGAVDVFDITFGTPTLVQLRRYSAVLTFTDGTPSDPVALGDVLADYVDAGGGVVSSMFGYTGGGWSITGRWARDRYEVIPGGSGITGGGPFSLGTVHAAGHPVMAGVTRFAGGAGSYRPTSTFVALGATLIAEWSDGKILVAEGANPQRIDLGFYPPSSDSRADFWDATTDGAKLICNSLLHVSRPLPRVLLVASEHSTAARQDVVDKLFGTGEFAIVDQFEASTATPTLALLRSYDGVLMYVNRAPLNSVALGDVLADYVDAGGGVLSAFAAQHVLYGLAGRWATGGYELLQHAGHQQGNPATLGLVNEPLHPIMQGVANFDGGPSSFRLTTTTLQPGARSICEWTDGTVLIAGGATSRRIDMNAFPFSTDGDAGGWVASSDGARLMANALLFVSRGVGGEVGTTYCTAGTTFDGCNATISASGRPSVSKAAGFLIDVTNMPGNKNGILFYGLSGPNSAPWGNSTSFLCVKAPTQRMGLLASGGAPNTCDGVFQLDWLDYVATHPGKLGVPFSPGCGVWVQAWFRDPAAGTGPVGAKGTATSNGLFFVTQP